MLIKLLALAILVSYFAFPLQSLAFNPAHPYTYYTYALAHVNVWHMLGNLIALLSFGLLVERKLGTFKLAVIVAVATPVAAIAMQGASIAGASGLVMGLMAASAHIAPRAKWVTPIGSYPARVTALGYMIVSVACVAFGWLPQVAHSAHIAGAVSGWLLCSHEPQE